MFSIPWRTGVADVVQAKVNNMDGRLPGNGKSRLPAKFSFRRLGGRRLFPDFLKGPALPATYY
jgi:hypothetical protein